MSPLTIVGEIDGRVISMPPRSTADFSDRKICSHKTKKPVRTVFSRKLSSVHRRAVLPGGLLYRAIAACARACGPLPISLCELKSDTQRYIGSLTTFRKIALTFGSLFASALCGVFYEWTGTPSPRSAKQTVAFCCDGAFVAIVQSLIEWQLAIANATPLSDTMEPPNVRIPDTGQFNMSGQADCTRHASSRFC